MLAKIEDPFKVHQKKRWLGNLRAKLERVEKDRAEGKVRIAFGSRKLWRAQYHLEANGYTSDEEWLTDWQSARNSEIFLMGSKEESGGCQLCVGSIQDDEAISLLDNHLSGD